jgi:N-acetylmuramoyl-L-alanine amidase
MQTGLAKLALFGRALLQVIGLGIALSVAAGALPAGATAESEAVEQPSGVPAANPSDPPAVEQSPFIVFAGRLTEEGGNTRLVLEVDRKPEFNVFFMANPDRFVVELDNGVFRFADEAAMSARGLVGGMRHGAVSETKARLVLDLVNPAGLDRKELESVQESGFYRLVLDLKPVSAAEFTRNLAEQFSVLGSSGSVVRKGDRVRVPEKRAGIHRVVIDPGHGGIDGGAIGLHGTLEKELTLKVARKVGASIEGLGGYEVHYTRDSDIFISLSERQRIARNLNADLLISIHADSLRQRSVRGATIYTLARRATDRLAAEVADSENLADVVAGLAAPEAQDDVTDILADLTLRETTRFSKHFSSVLLSNLKPHVRLINNPQRAASFKVLKNPEVPGVLLELGYLSNSEDEKMLMDDAWQERLAAEIAGAVDIFFKQRGAGR